MEILDSDARDKARQRNMRRASMAFYLFMIVLSVLMFVLQYFVFRPRFMPRQIFDGDLS